MFTVHILLILIGMINTLARRLLRPSLQASKRLIPIKCSFSAMRNNQYRFGEWKRQQFIAELDQEIDVFQGHLQRTDNKDNLQYFTKDGWTVTYLPDKGVTQYSKKNKTHEVKVFSSITDNPPNDPNQTDQKTHEEEGRPKRINFVRVVVWLRKKGSPKWLVAEMGVLQGGVELTTLFFSQAEPGVEFQLGNYSGPDVQTLPQEILSAVNWALQSVGLKVQTIMNMVINASSKADELDVAWMKNLKTILQ